MSEAVMRAAVLDVQGGMPLKTAAKRHGIARNTLRYHVQAGPNKKNIGHPTVLNVAQEEELCNRIFRLAAIGMPINNCVLRRSVFSFCEMNAIPHTFNQQQKMAGWKWVKLFLKRHRDVAYRKAESMNQGRAMKMNRVVVAGYFEKLRAVLMKEELMQKPQCIYNMDEKGCRLTLHHPQKVYAATGAKRVPIVAPEHAESVTIVACGNATGQVVPPMVLFRGKRSQPEYSDDMPPGTAVVMTDKASMTCETFIKWLDHFASFKTPGKALLIFDGAKSHLDANIVYAAEKHDVTLFCLPSNCSHELQPLDKAVFGPFEKYWDPSVLNYWNTRGDRNITKARFGTIFTKVWLKSVTPENVMAGFRATGIFPFDPHCIPDSAFAPSEVTYHPREQLQVTVANDSREEDDSHTHGDLDKSFNELLNTPKRPAVKKKTRPAINQKGCVVTRDLFIGVGKKVAAGKTKRPGAEKRSRIQKTSADWEKPGPSGVPSKKKESWFCAICRKDRIADMRLCTLCGCYVHEKCAGVTGVFRGRFVCPDCDE